jgi:DNA-binding SARP family transcriptional activator
MARDPLEVRLLGRFAVLRNGVEVPPAAFGGRKARRLLRLLALERDGFASHDRLADALWGERPPADPAGNLSVLVTRVRSALGDPSSIVSAAGGYRLSVECVVDLDEVSDTVERARALLPSDPAAALTAFRTALTRWSEDVLAEDLDEPWAQAHRTIWLRRRQEALEDAAEAAIEAHEPTLALEWAEAAMAADPFRERGHLTAARAYAASGATAAALEVLARFTRRLADELGLDPSPAVDTLRRDLLLAGAGRRSPRVPGVGLAAAPVLPFLGRRDVLTTLAAATNIGPDGRAGVVVLRGDPGAGKSRLLAEWMPTVASTVAVRAFLPNQADALAVARQLFQAMLARDPTRRSAVTGPAADAVATVLLQTDHQDRPQFDPETFLALLTDAAVKLVHAAGCPTVVIDDLQWADRTSLRLMESVLAQVDEVPCVVAVRASETAAASASASFFAALGSRRRIERVELPPLTAEDLGTAVVTDLAAALVGASGGNAFAVVDLLRGLHDAGLVVAGPDGWVLVPRPHALDEARRMLQTMAAEGRRRALRTTVSRLHADERDLLIVLSLLARPVPVATLAACLTTSPPDTLRRLTGLDAADLVRRSGPGWATSHDLVRETVALDLPEAERALAHQRIASALDDTDADPAEVGHHLAAAGDGDAAAARFVEAAERLVEGAADTEAAALIDRGMDAAHSRHLRRRLLALRSRLHARRGNGDQADVDLAAALDGCPAGPLRAALLTDQAMLHLGSDDVRRAASLVELALVESAGEDLVQARALEVASIVAMNLDRPDEATESAERARILYVAAGDGAGAARVLDARAMAVFLDGRISDAMPQFRQAADLFTVSGALVRTVTPRSTLGHALVFADRATEGLIETEAALDLARALGHREGQSYALWHTAEAQAALGHHDQAIAAADEALDIARALGHRGWTATAWRATGIAHQVAGRLDEAEHAFRQSLGTSAGFSLFTSWAAARLALVLLARQRIADAEPYVAVALAEGPGLARYEADLAAVELAAMAEDGRRHDLARDALRRCRTGGHLAHVARLVDLAERSATP